MTAKNYLSQIRALELTARILERKMEDLREQAAGLKAVAYDKDKVQSTPKNAFEETMVRLAETEAMYKKAIADHHQAVQTRTQQIGELEKPEHVKVLMLRYVDGLRYDDIAERMEYSTDWVKHLHQAALEEFERRHEKTLFSVV